MVAYHAWAETQTARGQAGAQCVGCGSEEILANVPPCPYRSTAMLKSARRAWTATRPSRTEASIDFSSKGALRGLRP